MGDQLPACQMIFDVAARGRGMLRVPRCCEVALFDMGSSSKLTSRKARSKAEADFATWLMMAKLGSFDHLPSNAQNFLTNYRARLETMSEAESTALALCEVYSAYYSELGGVGTAPEPQARKPKTERKVEHSRGRETSQRGRGMLRVPRCPNQMSQLSQLMPQRLQIARL